MFTILGKPHKDIHEPLDPMEIDVVVTRLLEGKLDVSAEECQALRFTLSGTEVSQSQRHSTHYHMNQPCLVA